MEWAKDLTPEQFLSCLSRFVARTSDNAPQFKVVKLAIDKLRSETLIVYNERLVALVKRSLQKGIGRKLLALDQLVTILTKVEVIINTRPLTYVWDEFDSGFTLTPAHFLTSHFEPLMMTSMEEKGADEDYNSVNIFTWNMEKGSTTIELLLEYVER